MNHRHALTLALALVLVQRALGQSFNIDFYSPGSPSAIPATTHGGAAAQPGWWNVMEPFVALDLAPVDLSLTHAVGFVYGTGVYHDWFQNPATGGDDDSLMDDGVRILGPTDTLTAQATEVGNGTYRVYVYAMAPDVPDQSIVTVNEATTGPQTCGGTWPGAHAQGVTYTRHTVHLTNGQIRVVVRPSAQSGFVNGIQIVRALDAFTPYCFGLSAICPCGNAGTPESGCENSATTGGGRLAASGAAWVGEDSMVLRATHLPPTTSALFFQGTTAIATAFGDGVRCVGGSIVRLAVKSAVAGACSYPGAGDAPVSVKGQVAGPGSHRYQVWYRNSAQFCTSSTFNLTNGLSVLWQL